MLQTFAQLAIAAGYQISIFTHRSVSDNCTGLKDKPVDWYIQRTEQSFTELVNAEKANLDRADLHVFITLLPTEIDLIKLAWKAPKVVIVHNGYTFLDFWGNLAPSMGGYLRGIRAFWQGRGKQVKQLLDFADYISFPDKEIKQHLEQRYSKQCDQLTLIDPLPFGLYEPEVCLDQESMSSIMAEHVITITVPGTVNLNNRDYQILYRVFKNTVPKLSVSVRLVFLGSIRGRQAEDLCQQMKQLENQYFEFLFFNDIIPQSGYESYLCQTDFAILPIKPHFDFGPVREYYGLSNTSGTINDLIRFGLPAILPAFYPFPEKLKSGIGVYENESGLREMILDWLTNRRFSEKRKWMRANCEHWSLEALSPSFQKTIKNCLLK